jgi:ACS family glucarate transporter-like MFS transporter
LLAVTATAAYLCRVNITIAGALVMDEFHLTQVQMGPVFSAFLAGYTLCMLPGGLLADRWGTRRIIARIAWGWVIVSALQAAVGLGPFGSSATAVIASFIVLRFLMGALAAPTYPAAVHGVAAWVPSSSHAFANGLVIGSVGLGSAIAPALVGAVMVRWNWRLAMLATAVPSLVMAAWWLTVRTPQATAPMHAHAGRDATGTRDRLRVVADLLRRPGFLLLTLSYSLQGYVGYIFVFWFYIYLVQVRHFDLLQGAVVSSLSWVFTTVAIPLGGIVSDWLVRGRLGPLWGRRLVPMIGMGGSGVFIAVGAHTADPYLAAASLAVATSLVLCVEGPYWTTMAGLAGERSGTGGGVMNTGCNVAGLLSPIVTPWLGAVIGWEPALHIAAALAIVAALLWFGIRPATQA